MTGKQKAFVEYYLGECKHNATEAANKAGYKGNRRQLQVQGSDNLSKPIIKQAISDRMKDLKEKTEITVQLQQAKHARLSALAEAKGDLATATRNEEDIGKTIGAYIDRTETGEDLRPKTFTDSELVRLKAIAKGLTKPDIKLHREA